jgi:signal transduction histidine kinase
MRPGFTCFYWLILGVGVGRTAMSASTMPITTSPWFALVGLMLLALVAVLVALLRLEQTRSMVRQQMAARTYERWRIARDLHDTLLPGVQSLLLRIHIWADDPALPGDLRAEIRGVWQQARDILVESRDRIVLLRNRDTTDTDLFATLESVAKTRSANEVPALEVTLKGCPKLLTNDAYHELADIAQEAIRNALQHAHAQRILVTVEYTPRSIALVVADDGCGVPSTLMQQSNAPAHYGIPGMSERARYLNAMFSLGPNEGCGTKVTVCVRGDIAFAERQGSGWSRVVTYLRRTLTATRLT